jgi:hypothetical protein
MGEGLGDQLFMDMKFVSTVSDGWNGPDSNEGIESMALRGLRGSQSYWGIGDAI